MNDAAALRASQRADASFAEQVFRKLLPDDEQRRAGCELVAREVLESNAVDPSKWGITLKPGLIRLNLGALEIFGIVEDTFHFVVDRELIDARKLGETDAVVFPDAGESLYQRVPGSMGVDLNASKLGALLPLISDAHKSLMSKAGKTNVHSMTAGAHSPGVLRYLEKVTGMVLPDPDYSTAGKVPKLSTSTLKQLFAEFQSTYWKSEKGRQHQEKYAAARGTAATNFAHATRLAKDGADLTDAVLNGMLPHSDTKGNQERGAWIHVAPAVTKSARMLFEGAGWVKAADWPTVSRRVFDFFSTCFQNPAELESQCSSLGLKGFQSGMLSPFLNALHPDEFLIINTKSLALINALGSRRFGASITDYPEANRAGRDLVAGVPEIQAAAAQEKIPAGDVFDAFSHWLYAEKKWWKKAAIEYWKVSPGESAEFWDEWRVGGYAAVEWDELGDLAGLTQEEFDARVAEGKKEHPDWTAAGAAQAWSFANIPEGSFVVANEGTTRVRAIGKVIGPYRFEEGATRFKHRLPVEWVDLNERKVAKPGWRKTLIQLKREEFEAIRESKGEEPSEGAWFGPRTFELLKRLDQEPSAAIYQEHGADFKRWVETPFQALFTGVAGKLPLEMTRILETEDRLFSRIRKNDYGRGGAWPYYWGAFYRKGGERTKSLQLFALLSVDGLSYGFAFGDYIGEQFDTFAANLRGMAASDLEALKTTLSSNGLLFRKSGIALGDEVASIEEWLELKDGGKVAGIIPADELIGHSLESAADRVASGFTAAFPLVQVGLGYTVIKKEKTGVSEKETAYGLDELEADTGFARDVLETRLRILRSKKQIVLQGPPGTGKTYLAQRLARVLTGVTDGLRETIQFHPAYAYEDFIQGIRPEVVDGGLSYRLDPGRFLDFCSRASARKGPCVLVIDEINRANLSRVFGELMYLFEYRAEAVPLAAGGSPFRVPLNVHIIGTMNTADRSIARMDYALRRRFSFIRLRPEYEVLRKHLDASNLPAESIIAVLKGINQSIEDPNFEIGISYFMRGSALRDQIRDIWECEIEPYLEEYFYDQPKKIDAWRWSRLASSDLQDWA